MKRRGEPGATLRRCARCGLPWLSVLATSVSIAYALTAAVVPGASADDTIADSRNAIVVKQPPAGASASGPPEWSTPAVPFDQVSRLAECDLRGNWRLYVGLNSWIPAEPMDAPCTPRVP